MIIFRPVNGTDYGIINSIVSLFIDFPFNDMVMGIMGIRSYLTGAADIANDLYR